MNLRDLQQQSWQVSEDHGFHEAMLNLPPKVLATYLKLFLTAGELCEAGEELRAGREFTEIYYEYDISGDPRDRYISDKPWCMLWTDSEGKSHFDTFDERPEDPYNKTTSWGIYPGKPAGFPIELADALIRLCDMAEDVGVDLSEATELKEAYNRTREFLHGKTA